MLSWNLVLALLLQVNPAAASNPIVIRLTDGQQLAIDHPIFGGFIESRETGEAVLLYRQKTFHGELKLSTVRRIDFGYEKGRPFILAVMLKTGAKLAVESAGRAFVTIKGDTGSGVITVQHPDPITSPARLSTKTQDRKNDLTIQYLEFPR